MKRFALLLCLVWACDDVKVPDECRNIPSGGCPLTNGVACQDPSCDAVYACKSGAWVFDHVCGPHDASVTDAPIKDAGVPKDVSTDVEGAFGGPGCGSLQSPDCMLGTALSCSPTCCGCEDLFVCRDGGWDFYGTCDDDAGIVPK